MEASLAEMLAVPPARAADLRAAAERLLAARHVMLTTHVNADGDGAGCEAAVAAWLEGRGIRVSIVNPTPFPEQFRFLLHRQELVVDWRDGQGEADAVLADADLFLVLDTSEASRLPGLAERLPRERTLVLDHHPPGPTAVGTGVQDPTASATGELIYDLILVSDGSLLPGAVDGLYVAILTDTGSFRYSNTSARTHAIAAALVARGIDVEAIYRRIYLTIPRRRLELYQRALATLETDSEAGLAWLLVTDEMMRQTGATHEDADGLLEFVRSIEGTEVGMLFRETPAGGTKISFRSNGDTNISTIARAFGGGGHAKAAGALLEEPPAVVLPRVLAAVHAAVAEVRKQ